MAKRLLESSQNDQANRKNSKIEKKEVSFYEEEETDDSFDSFYQDEEDDLSDIDWEEVSLDGSLTVTFGNIRRDREKVSNYKSGFKL